MLFNKNLNASIVLPDNSSTREVFAADELKKYLLQIFDVELPIISASDYKPFSNAILIGGPSSNQVTKEFISESEFDSIVPGPEGMLIKSFGDNILLLAGSSKKVNECERATIYAVYEFLERYLSCCLGAFSSPDVDAGEFVPCLDEAEILDIEYIKSHSDSPYRTAIVQYSSSAGNPDRALNIPFFDWLAKNRYNRILLWASIYEFFKKSGLISELERRGIQFTVGHHESSRLFIPSYGNEYFSEHYYETHPEYFKLTEDGSRFENTDPWGQWVYCSRNEALIETFANNVIKWIKENPLVDVIAIWPNDGISKQCLCDKCQKYSKIENYGYFTNEVIKRVNKSLPNIKFDLLIYVDLWECPEGTVLSDSIIIDESTWAMSGLRKVGKPDGSCLNGTFYEKNLLKWKKAGARVVYYDYYMGVYGGRQRLIPMADELQSVWKNFVKKGIDGSGTQIECYNMWNHLLNFYSFARTGYDNSLTLRDNVTALSKIFGDAAPVIANIMLKSEEISDGQVSIPECGHYMAENLDMDWVYSEFDKALNIAKSKRERNNIRLFRMVYRYTDIETKEKLSPVMEPYHQIMEDYDDPTGELSYMTRFDSFWKNDPGFGITIPVKDTKDNFQGNIWYDFE